MPAEQQLRDLRINRIFEGSSEIMKLLIAREAVDAHLAAAGDLASEDASLSNKARAAVGASGFYAKWLPKLTSDEEPITPYRVLWDLQHNVDVANTIITHDAGSPRDQLSPFWKTVTPLSYIGWGKSTQLGYGLGLAMGAKLACPDKLCINVWGDAAIGFTPPSWAISQSSSWSSAWGTLPTAPGA